MTTENLSLTDLIYDITWSLQINSIMKNIQFEHHFDADYIEINAKEEYLGTAFSNILCNALRYATSKMIISIESSSRSLKLTISNDGEPVSDQDLPHIFERFYKGKGGQTSIGLALTKEIIEKHHGKLSVSSTERETSFQLLLP
ncbi:TPA: sensor histidine kinase [Streptococcus suis]|nr:sensor histidine kinase [Streptococcus suis]